ncbi:hypothetical protein VTO58DRAFT_108554 [Aureobasidium pullulans]
MDSLESSLRRLDRPWVDIFYVHQCDAAATLTKMMVPLTSAVKATHIRAFQIPLPGMWQKQTATPITVVSVDLSCIAGHDRIVTQELRKVATKADATIANTALAYMKHVSPEAVPIVRVSSVKQLESRVQALHTKITASDIRQIAAAARIRPIFSHEPLPYTRQQDAA